MGQNSGSGSSLLGFESGCHHFLGDLSELFGFPTIQYIHSYIDDDNTDLICLL